MSITKKTRNITLKILWGIFVGGDFNLGWAMPTPAPPGFMLAWQLFGTACWHESEDPRYGTRYPSPKKGVFSITHITQRA